MLANNINTAAEGGGGGGGVASEALWSSVYRLTERRPYPPHPPPNFFLRINTNLL